MLELNKDQQYSMLTYLAGNEQVQETFYGYVEMQQLYRAAIKEISAKLEILNDEFMVRYDHNPIHHMQSRLKTPQSLVAKLVRRGCEISVESARANIFDIAGIRVVCCYVDDIYQVSELLLQHNDMMLLTTKDYIANPKENGYRSLHLVVSVPVILSDRAEMVPVEIQIRTMAMDFWASLEHHLYYKTKDKENFCDTLSARLKQCAEDSARLDFEMQEIFHALNGEESTPASAEQKFAEIAQQRIYALHKIGSK